MVASAGGCSNNLWQYFQNPQWRLDIPRSGKDLEELILFLECPAEHSVNIRLFEGTVARPEMLRRAESSGPYRQGCCMLRVNNLAPGPYIALVSTFRPGLCCEYRLAWHSSLEIRIGPQPHPFAVPPPSPLESASWRLPCGKTMKLQLSVTGGKPALLSARLQSNRKDGVLPSLGMLCESDRTDPVKCEHLTKSFADTYFAFSGATVLLGSTITLGLSYVLEVFVPQEGDQGEAALYVMSDEPLSLSSVDEV